MIDPEFWLDEGVAELSAFARLLYIGIWGLCDDNYATFPNRPKWIKAQVFPYDDVNTPQLLTELSEKGKIVLFTADDGEEYFYIKNFFKYQRVEKPSKPKYPQFKENSRVVPDSSPTTPAEVKLSKEKLREDKLSNSPNGEGNLPISSPDADIEISDTKTINALIGLFKPINPSFARLYSNKTERDALERMVKQYSYEWLEGLISQLPDIVRKPYAPSITTPYQLERNMGKLKLFLEKAYVERGKGGIADARGIV